MKGNRMRNGVAGKSVYMSAPQLDQVVGQPVDLSPWAYAWRADRAVQAMPEAYFIPRRLARIDQVYRTALSTLGPDQIVTSQCVCNSAGSRR
jgi:hypothetical protein